MFDEIELGRMYAQLPQTEREALDETIMDQGINSLKSLIAAVSMVETYFKESSMSKLSFKEFQATRKAVTWDKARCQAEGFNDESMEVLRYGDGEDTLEDGLFIECHPDFMYQLVIGELIWFDARLEMLEQLLYDHRYL